MARLIVEAGGNTRRFKLGDGKLTLGSGEGATLTLDSEELAEIHADLEVVGEKVILRVRKGTTAARVRGVVAKGDLALKPGVKVVLGDVTLTLEPPEAAGRAAGGVGASRPRAGASGATARRRVQRSRPSSNASLPSWLIVVIILAVAAVGFFLFRNEARDIGGEDVAPTASKVRIETSLGEADFRSARKELDKVRRHWKELDPSWYPIFEGLEKKTQEAEKRAALLAKNGKGDDYFQRQLENFVTKYLDTPNRPAARVLLKRINWFEKEYPLHPKLDWCRRMRDRWRPVAELSEPPTYDDMEFEVKTMTWAMPRDYKTAFGLIDAFIATASGSDKTRAEALRAKHEGERREYFIDRLQQAKHEYGQDSAQTKASAVRWLTELVTKIGDPEMADEAAGIMVAIPGIEGPLQGYYNYERETFDALMENDIVRRFVQEKGVIEGL